MEHFDKWQEYWDNYLLNKHGKEEVSTEDDLFFQVARTVQKKPVEKEVFDEIIKDIIHELRLQKGDTLVDFCCGNGLFTYELKDHATKIIGCDFSPQIIATANKYKSAGNITYCLGGVIEFLQGFAQQFPGVHPNKYLMNDALAYFSPDELEQMLQLMMTVSPKFDAALRGVPDDGLKWNFYNTPERKEKYLENVAKGDLTNDGLGRWWSQEEVKNICSRLNLKVVITNPPTSHYRMDIVISRA